MKPSKWGKQNPQAFEGCGRLDYIVNRFRIATTPIRVKIMLTLPHPEKFVAAYMYLRRYYSSQPFIDGCLFERRFIDPTDIIGVSDNKRPLHWGEIKGGDWDLDPEPFTERPVYRALRQHYIKEVPWGETPLKGVFDQKMTEGGAWGYTSVTEFEERVAEIEQLVESIRTEGYRSKRELARESPISTNDPVPPMLDEVTIDIGRDGSVLWRDLGQHRLAIAQLFEVKEIPVYVATRHADLRE